MRLERNKKSEQSSDYNVRRRIIHKILEQRKYMNLRSLYKRYADFIAQRTPIYRWAVPVLTMDVLTFAAAGISYLLVGSHWMTVTLAILGCSLFSTLHFMIRLPWIDRKNKESDYNDNEQ